MKKIKITKVRSGIDKPLRQKRTLEALGFKKMHQVIEVEAIPQMLGMIEKVRHLITIEEID